MGSTTSIASLLSPHHASGIKYTDLPIYFPTRLHMLFQSHARLPCCVTPLLKQFLPVSEYQPIVHLLRSLPRIRSRLTLRRRSLLRNPYAFGGKDSHLSFRYSYQHSHFPQVHQALQLDFYPMGTLPYPVYISIYSHSFGFVL